MSTTAATDEPTTATDRETDFDGAMRRELDRRIADLAATGDDAFGRIGPAEWAVTIGVTVVLPLLVVWWLA